MDINKLKHTSTEFLRYAVVGGISFLVDFGVLYLCHSHILKSIPYSLYISTALGFFAGLVTNYLLCLKFVFTSAKNTNQGKSGRDKILFTVIGVIGFLMNEFGMKLGVEVLSVHYLIVKIFVAGIVLLWNYLARKYMIFNNKEA